VNTSGSRPWFSFAYGSAADSAVVVDAVLWEQERVLNDATLTTVRELLPASTSAVAIPGTRWGDFDYSMVTRKYDLATRCEIYRSDGVLISTLTIVPRMDLGGDDLLATGSAEAIVRYIAGRAGVGAPAGYDAVWDERAMKLVRAMVLALVELRDAGHLVLTTSKLREHLALDRIEALSHDERLRATGAVSALTAYLRSLPLWKPAAEHDEQDSETLRQHGFAMMYFTRSPIFIGAGETDREGLMLNPPCCMVQRAIGSMYSRDVEAWITRLEKAIAIGVLEPA